jgi:cytidylate kinase
MGNKISLAGDLGSGKSTVAKLLIEALGAEYYSTGAIVRAVAEKRGMSVADLNVYMETHPEIDKEIDDGLALLSEDERPLVIDSRMAWHFTKGTFKVYLSTDAEVAALRIMNAGRTGESTASLEVQVSETKRRRESEKKRYSEKYGVDIQDLSNYDLVVDTTYATPEVIADCIVNCFEKWRLDKSFSGVYISPERLNYPEREIDAELVGSLATKLELGEEIPTPEIAEENGEFYLVSGFESAMAYSMSFSDFVIGKLVSEKLDCEYVKMRNSL